MTLVRIIYVTCPSLFSCHTKVKWDLNRFSPPLKKSAACPPSLLPGRTNAIFICSGLQLQKLPAGTPGYFSPPLHLLSIMPFMPRGENSRSARSVNQTMWRTCGVFCAWSLLFLTDVCAQAQRRYIFIVYIFFPIIFKSFLSKQGVNAACGEAAPVDLEFIQWDPLQSWLCPVRTCGALNAICIKSTAGCC